MCILETHSHVVKSGHKKLYKGLIKWLFCWSILQAGAWFIFCAKCVYGVKFSHWFMSINTRYYWWLNRPQQEFMYDVDEYKLNIL